jgi:MFS family permease
MENNEERKIEIGQETLKILNTTRKWTLFLAIIGFIGIGVLLIAGLFTGVFLSVFNTSDAAPGFSEIMVFAIVVLLALAYFFPVLYLLRFSKYTYEAIRSLDKQKLHKAFRSLKAYYVYIGILIIVVLILYLIFFIALGTSMSFIKDLELSQNLLPN